MKQNGIDSLVLNANMGRIRPVALHIVGVLFLGAVIGTTSFTVEFERVPTTNNIAANTSYFDDNATCIYDWGSGEFYAELMTINPGEFSAVTGLFTHTGNHTFSVFCLTEGNIEYSDLHTMYVGKPIFELTSIAVTIPMEFPIKEDAELPLNLTYGTDVEATVTLLPSGYMSQINISEGTNTVILPKEQFSQPGMYVVEISAWNPITNQYNIAIIISANRITKVESVDLGPKALALGNLNGIAITGEPFSIAANFTGDDVAVLIDIKGDRIVGYYCSGYIKDFNVFSVTLYSSNNYSVVLWLSNYYPPSKDIQYPAFYSTVIQMSAYRNLSSINVEFENAFSPISTPLTVSITATGIVSELAPFTCTVDPTDGTVPYSYISVPQKLLHSYTIDGFFNVTVVCVADSEESYVQYVPDNVREFSSRVYKEVPLSNLLITHDAVNASHYPVSRPLRLNIAPPDASDPNFSSVSLTCVLDFGVDKFTSQTFLGGITVASNMTIDLKFPGGEIEFILTVNCSKYLSYYVSQPMKFYVYLDCWQYPFFDAAYRDATYPRVADVSKSYEIVASVKFSGVDACLPPHKLSWEVFDDGSQKVDMPTPVSISFYIPPGTFNAEQYMFRLTSSFLGNEIPSNYTDITYVKFEYSHLQAVLTDSMTDTLVRKVLHSEKIVIDSTLSYDPANGQDSSNTMNNTLGKAWSCFQCPPNTKESDITVYTITDYKPFGAKPCEADPFIGDYEQGMYFIAPYTLSLNIWYIFELSVFNNNRSSITRQALYVYNKKTLTLEIACIRNCIQGLSHRYKLRHDTLELNAKILDKIDQSSARYYWKLQIFNPKYNVFIDISDRIMDSRETTGFKVDGSSFSGDAEGSKYQVVCEVYLTGNTTYDKTSVYRQFAMNLVPYGGTCEIDGNPTEVLAGIQDVCIACKNWKDEGKFEARDPLRDIEEGRSLRFESRQRYLHPDKTINTDLRANFLAPSNNLHHCVRVRLPEDGVDYTMIEVAIKDEFEKPSATQQFILKVKNPIANSSTNNNVTQISEVMASAEQAINDAREVGDVQTLLQVVDSMSSLLFTPDLEYDPMTFDTAGISDIKDDGTHVSASEAAVELGKPQPEPYEEALRDAKVKLLGYLKDGQSLLTEFEKTKGSTQILMLSAVTNILSGSEKIINNTILEDAGEILDNVLNNVKDTAKDNFGSEQFSELSEGIVRAVGTLSDAIVPDDMVYYIDIDAQSEARQLNNELLQVYPPEILEKLEDSLLTEDERNYFLTKRQLQLKTLLESRVAVSQDQSARINTMLEKMVAITGTCDLCATVIGDEDVSRVVISRIPKDNVGDTTVYGKTASVELSSMETYDDKVSIGLYEGSQVVHMDPSGSFSTITSKEVYLNFDSELAIFNEKLSVKFKVPLPGYTIVEPIILPEDADKLHRQNVFVRRPDEFLCLVVKPLAETVTAYKIWVSCSGTVTKLNYDATEVVTKKNSWKTCFSPKELKMERAGTCNYGIETSYKSSDTVSVTSNNTELPQMNLTAATMNFKVWDEASGVWRNDMCGMTWEPDDGHLIGECPTKKKITFANSFYVPTNTIDFKAAFLKFSPKSQAAVLGTISTIFVVYMFVVIWARRADKNDLLKWGITPLADNFAVDNYYYVIRVYTGLRPGAGTRSRIGLIVVGEETDTGLRELSDGIRKEFTTGSVMNFLMSTPVCLGYLEYIRLWSYSADTKTDSWYISKLEIQDVQRDETFTFLAERWLAVDKEDGLLECVIPVCHSNNLNTFRNRFYGYTKETLADSHIWVSVLYRPQSSHASRVQRSGCALVFIFLTMLSNAMFYKEDNDYETESPLKAGPFRLSTHQIYTSIISVLLTTPITMLIFYMFKYSKPVKSDNDTPGKEGKSKCKYRIPFIETKFERLHHQSIELERKLLAKGFPKSEGFSLPPCFLYAARILVAFSVLLSAFLILLYSMEWGKQKSEKWLSAFFLSLLESVVLLDPIKVIALALIVAVIFRNVEHPSMVIDRHTIMQAYESGHHQKPGEIRMPAPPVDHDRLQAAKKIREREARMKTALKDFIVNLFIIWITFSIGYSTKDRWSYHMQQEVVDSLLEARNPGQTPFSQVKTIHQYYNWLENTAIRTLFPEQYVSGRDLHWRLKQFMQDGAKLRVGPPRLRQLRSSKKKCNNPYIGDTHCNTEYKDSTEDMDQYCLGWSSVPCHTDEIVYKHSSDAWKYTSALDIWGIPIRGHYNTYGGGGYIVKLSVNRDISHEIIEELFNNSWIDSRTRAVAFEFTLYCINANLFTYNIFLTEFPATGGIFQYSAVFPLRLHMHNGTLGLYTLACESIFILYIILMTVLTGMEIYHQRKDFFKKSWQLYDFVFISISYVAIIMYFLRVVMTKKALDVFKEDKKEFVNFVHIVIWDQMYTLFIGILVFMSTLRMLNILGYNKRITAVARVFTYAANELLWFGVFFFYIIISNAIFGYLLFGSQLASYRDVYKSMGTLFISMIGKSRFTEIEQKDPIMSKVYFMMFVISVVYILLTMFLAILSMSIDQVQKDMKGNSGDEMVDFILNKFKAFLSYFGAGDQRQGELYEHPLPWGLKKGQWPNKRGSPYIISELRTSLKDGAIYKKKVQQGRSFHSSILKMGKGKKMMSDFK